MFEMFDNPFKGECFYGKDGNYNRSPVWQWWKGHW